jgi:hypothetical protein
MLAQSEKKQLDELDYLVLPGIVPTPMLASSVASSGIR